MVRAILGFLILASMSSAQSHRLVIVPNSAGQRGFIGFREEKVNGTHEVRLRARTELSGDLDLTLPDSDGDGDVPLTTDGLGNLGFRSTINAIYVYGTDVNGLHLEQRGGALGLSHLYLRNQVGDIGARIKCDSLDRCDIGLEGDTSKLHIRMEGEAGFKITPPEFGGGTDPEIQCCDQASYPSNLALAINKNAVTVPGGKPMLLQAADGTFTGWVAANGSENKPYAMPVNAMAPGDCIKGLNAAASPPTTEWGACGGGGAPSFELPINMTTSGVNKITFINNLGNSRMFMKNSSGIDGVQLETFFGGAQLALFDSSGDGRLELYTGTPSAGATGKFYQADTARVGVQIEGGAFTGETGRVFTRDYLDQQRVRIDDMIRVYVSGAATPSVELFQAGGNGELLLRNGFGVTTSRVTSGGFVYSGSTPQSFTVNISCPAGTGTLSVNGSIITGKTGAC